MSDAKVRGLVHLVEETKTFGQKGFRKRQVVLEQNNGRFPNFIPVEFIGDGCEQADGLKVGDEIEITYRLNGRKWQRDADSEVKYFLSCEAIRFTRVADKGSSEDDINSALNEEHFDDGGDVPF